MEGSLMVFKNKGFTLLEVLVAVFIMVTVLGVLMGVIGQNFRLLDKALKALRETHILNQVAHQIIQTGDIEEGETTREWNKKECKVVTTRIEEYRDVSLYKVCITLNQRILCFLHYPGSNFGEKNPLFERND
ncbi:MAG TPA: type II secretion system protein [Candidatus Desulfofervidus auxilii]|uniref:Type II secretion system protein n=1 Tax=Desulfofervidus auxilii TaxID=1621989 RepID=A0A7C2A8Q8_DESA2|nr:type II secretion system protein [Candidatus Desulfofervidus auxilii]